MRRPALWLLMFTCSFAIARAHDIPNARVDRATQVTLHPGRLAVDYEVSLSELTLTQDLRALIGSLPDGDSALWFDRYGRETAPLNGKGFLISANGLPVDLRGVGFDLSVEQHPRYTFHYEAALPTSGRLSVRDTNYVASEGTSRLAVRGLGGVTIRGDELPSDLKLIPARPLWQLSDAEERRTRQIEIEFSAGVAFPAPNPVVSTVSKPVHPTRPTVVAKSLSRLLDRGSGVSFLTIALLAFGLGAAHAVQPGHGKTLVAAAVVSERGSWLRGALLALITTATHTGSVLLVALGLWITRSTRYAAINATLAHVAGFAIAAIGLWRLGRHLAGYGEHQPVEPPHGDPGRRNIVALGIAGGLVPCWDAVALILVAEAVGRLTSGIALLVAFGLGMAAVLVAVGSIAARFRRYLARPRAERWAGIVGSAVLSLVGLVLLATG